MLNYQIAPEAVDDLLGIARYTIRTWGKEQAQSYETTLERSFAVIAKDVENGRVFSKRRPDLRFVRSKHHFVFYLIEKDKSPLILAVFHERMDLINRLKKRLDP